MDYSSMFMCLMGASTVFLGLICLGVWRIAGNRTSEQTVTPAAASAPAPLAPTPQASPAANVSQELIAAISAAIAEELGTDITGIRITSIKQL